jgi:hypothetical protein
MGLHSCSRIRVVGRRRPFVFSHAIGPHRVAFLRARSRGVARTGFFWFSDIVFRRRKFQSLRSRTTTTSSINRLASVQLVSTPEVPRRLAIRAVVERRGHPGHRAMSERDLRDEEFYRLACVVPKRPAELEARGGKRRRADLIPPFLEDPALWVSIATVPSLIITYRAWLRKPGFARSIILFMAVPVTIAASTLDVADRLDWINLSNKGAVIVQEFGVKDTPNGNALYVTFYAAASI